MKFLLLQIYAPLVSWGDIAFGGERRSNRQPTKSAITGLVAAALGIKRVEEERLKLLTDSLGMSVQLFSGGSMLKDYHTTQVPKRGKVYHTRREELLAPKNKIGTILSNREYRCDALAVVALYLKNETSEFSLEGIKGALQKPRFHLYFGRKSCVPSLPLSPKMIESSNLREAFKGYEVVFPIPLEDKDPDWLKSSFLDYPKGALHDENGITYFWEEGVESGFEKESHSVERYDLPISRKRWQFTSRREYMAIEKGASCT